MKFIFNFIFFGLLFYIIALYFPDAFTTLKSTAESVVTFAKEAFITITERIKESSSSS